MDQGYFSVDQCTASLGLASMSLDQILADDEFMAD